jgi:hypothetical protein
MYVGVGVAGRKERVAPGKGVRVVVDVLYRDVDSENVDQQKIVWVGATQTERQREDECKKGRRLRRGDDKVRSS